MASNKNKTLSDSDILTALRAGRNQQEEIIAKLLKAYEGLFYKGKRRYGLSEEDARDAYADSMLALSKQVQSGKFRGQSQISTYFY